jgi:hypothetical protein
LLFSFCITGGGVGFCIPPSVDLSLDVPAAGCTVAG